MAHICSVQAIEILDSRGFPTIEVQVAASNGIIAAASVPSGASTGEAEALELRDNDTARYFGKGVKRAIDNVNGPIAKLVVGQKVCDQERLDKLMIDSDGTHNKSQFGANAILAVSMAMARAGAQTAGLPLYRYLGGTHSHILPCPMMNIINGGLHADNSIDFQEFMIRPHGAPTCQEAIRCGAEIFHALKLLLKGDKLVTAVGDEGGFAPDFSSAEDALEYIVRAIEKAGYRPGRDVSLALDCAASSFYDRKSGHYVEKKKQDRQLAFQQRTSEEQVTYLAELCQKFPIDSIEDGLDEHDWDGWKLLTERLGANVQIVGDDLFVTNSSYLQKGIDLRAANAILIKLNQIGTVTETLETIRLAQSHGFATVISHRSGETEDSFIADLSVAVNAGQIKTGSMCRSDRVAKYNRLIKIENELSPVGLYKDSNKVYRPS